MKSAHAPSLLPLRNNVLLNAALLIATLMLSTNLFAAAMDDDNPWRLVSKKLVIGNVTLLMTNLEIHVTGSNLDVRLPWPLPPLLDYVCAVRNPFAQPVNQDGVVQNDKNFIVLKDPDALKSGAFTRFAFFSARPTTIGLMTGRAGADGGSSQELFLVDVESCTHVLIHLSDARMPLWLERTNYPPAFATQRMQYWGLEDSMGARWYADQVFRFSGGQYRRDTAMEQRVMLARFQQAQLTATQRQKLRNARANSMDDVEYPEVQALCDFVYYGTRSGNAKAVDELGAVLQPDIRDLVIIFQKRFSKVAPSDSGEPGSPNAMELSKQAASRNHTVKKGETEFAIAKLWGISIKALEESNPGLSAKHLTIGRVLVIPSVQAPELSHLPFSTTTNPKR